MTRPAHTLVRSDDPETSRAAAFSLDSKSMMDQLLAAYYQRWTGLTAEEAAEQAGYGPEHGAWKRVSDLLYMGMIEVALTQGGRTMTRPGASGRQQRVLVITAAGRLEHEWNASHGS